jgi:hypothetical protein
MKLTILHGEKHEPWAACINPERVDGARPAQEEVAGHRGTLLYVGPEELLVEEPFDLVRDELEEAWEARRGSKPLDELLEQLRPLTQFLPMAIGMAVGALQKKAQATVPESPVPPAPGVDDDAQEEDPQRGPLEAVQGLEVTCPNCKGVFAPARLCPGCGCVLVGEG